MLDADDEARKFTRAHLNAELTLAAARDGCPPAGLMTALKADPYLARQYDRDSGVFEGYTLERHTLMVLGQFEKYFASKRLAGDVTRPYFRVFLALHDIGKPLAVLAGDKSRQHEFSSRIIPVVMTALRFGEAEKTLALSLVAGDPIGRFLRGKITASDAARRIQEQARPSGLPLATFFALLTTYYKCDAGSYTADAGGIPSLDRLFHFDHEHGELNFAPDVAARFALLEEEIVRL